MILIKGLYNKQNNNGFSKNKALLYQIHTIMMITKGLYRNKTAMGFLKPNISISDKHDNVYKLGFIPKQNSKGFQKQNI